MEGYDISERHTLCKANTARLIEECVPLQDEANQKCPASARLVHS